MCVLWPNKNCNIIISREVVCVYVTKPLQISMLCKCHLLVDLVVATSMANEKIG